MAIITQLHFIINPFILPTRWLLNLPKITCRCFYRNTFLHIICATTKWCSNSETFFCCVSSQVHHRKILLPICIKTFWTSSFILRTQLQYEHHKRRAFSYGKRNRIKMTWLVCIFKNIFFFWKTIMLVAVKWIGRNGLEYYYFFVV